MSQSFNVPYVEFKWENHSNARVFDSKSNENSESQRHFNNKHWQQNNTSFFQSPPYIQLYHSNILQKPTNFTQRNWHPSSKLMVLSLLDSLEQRDSDNCMLESNRTINSGPSIDAEINENTDINENTKINENTELNKNTEINIEITKNQFTESKIFQENKDNVDNKYHNEIRDNFNNKSEKILDRFPFIWENGFVHFGHSIDSKDKINSIKPLDSINSINSKDLIDSMYSQLNILPLYYALPPPIPTQLKSSMKGQTFHHHSASIKRFSTADHPLTLKFNTSSINANSSIDTYVDLYIDKYVIFSENCRLECKINGKIGPFVFIGPGSYIENPIYIQNHIYIGANVIIEKEVRIQSFVKILDNSVVEERTLLVEGFVYGGRPAKAIGLWKESSILFEKFCRNMHTKDVAWE